MKKILILFFLIIFCSNYVLSETVEQCNCKVFQSDNKKYYGLKKDDEIVVKPIYKKVIKIGNNAWLIQNKRDFFGLMACNGEILVKPKYLHANRVFDKWAKLGNENDYGLYDDKGNAFIPPEFSMIEPLFGRRFLTCKKYKYGVYSYTGEMLLSNRYDMIYMPKPNIMRVKYKNTWYELEKTSKNADIKISDEFFDKISSEEQSQNMFVNTGLGASYSVITATDYTLKVFSSIPHAYEDSIDELTLSKGLDVIPVLMSFSWLPKFPAMYARKYYRNVIKPDNSPLSGVRNNLKSQMK